MNSGISRLVLLRKYRLPDFAQMASTVGGGVSCSVIFIPINSAMTPKFYANM